ncbi:MAG: GNAT family N-acetyltransferase [Ruminococcus sp.]|nr:GNAT family N-acetyltransferase [Ruminococcus sp.]
MKKDSTLFLRKYSEEDLNEIADLFYNTVHFINIRDYSLSQVNVWADGKIDFDKWNRSFLKHYSIVALKHDAIVGFGDIDKTHYLDRLFVHKDYQGQGIASAICNELEKHAAGHQVTVHASITAKGFFENKGYRVLKEQQVERSGILLKNYVMEKYIRQ